MLNVLTRRGAVVVAVVVAGLAVGDASLVGPPGADAGGLSEPTSTGTRESQGQMRAAGDLTGGVRGEVAVQNRSRTAHQQVLHDGCSSEDLVRIDVDGTKLMRGHKVLATLREGQELKVLKVQGPWLGTSVVVDGQKLSGWVPLRQITPVDAPLHARESQVSAQINGRTHDTGQAVVRSQDVTTGWSYGSRGNVGTRSNGRWHSSSRPMPESLRNFRWGWWDLKDR